MVRWRPAQPRVRRDGGRVLGDDEVGEALALCALDPVASVLASSRLVAAEFMGIRRAGGQLWGFPAEGPLEAICWSGSNLVPVVEPDIPAGRLNQACAAFAALAGRYGRRSSSIVGEREPVLGMWSVLSERWPAARDVRANQPSMAIDRTPDVAPDPDVRRSEPSELDVILPACVAMFTEEVGYSPLQGGRYYEDRVQTLIASGRSFVRMADPPEVVFKAEIGAAAGKVAQVQGVWVAPHYRGQGLASPGMAAVVEQARSSIAPVVSLYVNDYNTRAYAAYRRVGFEQVGTYATVLF